MKSFQWNYIYYLKSLRRRCYDFNLKVFPQKHININLCAAAMYCIDIDDDNDNDLNEQL